jgi:predicted nucleic acid-binding protein
MLYVDTSAFVPIFVRESRSLDVVRTLAARTDAIVLSAWVLTETYSSISLKIRTGALTDVAARAAREQVVQAAPSYQIEAVLEADFDRASQLICELRSPLRAADALHLAICSRVHADLLTLDVAMKAAAREAAIVAIDA